jgi:imidazolonepropionase-like amidohydrolase
MNQSIVFENARILDGSSPEGEHDRHVRVASGLIVEVSDKPIKDGSARRIDLKGKTLMPGLIDCHVHVTAVVIDPGQNAKLPDVTVAYRTARVMKDMLLRGFTTVRDVGGATFALQEAVEQKLIEAPRLVICGKALSQTGGHTDFRGRYDNRPADSQTYRLGSMGRICDGVDECRRAARDEIRQGAQFIKVMANGGVASPTDPIAFLGFSVDELTAIVEEASNAQTYVSAHLYTDEAIARALNCGIRSIEHANLIEPATARLLREKGAIACPTLVAYEALKSDGEALGMPSVSVQKIDDVRLSSPRSLEIMHEAGVSMAYGSDLLGGLHKYQSDEFLYRGRVLPAIDVIRSATCIAAELIGMPGKIGVLKPGAYADLIVVDGDPLANLALLTEQGRYMPAIIKDGEFVKDNLSE